MVNASLNWASIVGILLVISGIPLFAFSVVSISRISSSSSDYVFRILNLIGLLFIPFLCGGILFFQGWRLDPILQFGQFLLVAHIINLQIALILSETRKSRKEFSLLKEPKTIEPFKGETSTKDSFGNIETYLETLQKWKTKKLITEEDFQAKKKKLLDF